jgi:fructose-1,6-bisphosphatase/inositol monophosphatase family enzyme
VAKSLRKDYTGAMKNDPFSASPLAPIVQTVEEAVVEAARYLDNAARTGATIEVSVKADHTLVMNLDVESQRRVLSKLPEGHPVVAEEDESSHGIIHSAGTYFLVDPLDGTTSCKRFFGQKGGHVGYGPLVGYVREGQLSVASFFSVPHGRLFTAVKGLGTYVSTPDFSKGDGVGTRERLSPQGCSALVQAGVLFFVGHHGETRVMQHLKNHNAIENMYRFGGFANDCARLAQGFEQMSVQFAAKPWDFSAVLLAAEAGLEVWVDPLGRRIPLREWRIESNNPSIIIQPGIRDEFFKLLDSMS